eukprot:Platyproteum_vivax@DN15498_c0_g1_i1.p1
MGEFLDEKNSVASTLGVVACHLAAGQEPEAVVSRTNQFWEIVERLWLPQSSADDNKFQHCNAYEIESCLWMGDVNSRLNSKALAANDVSIPKVQSMLAAQKGIAEHHLAWCDELLTVQKEGLAWVDFRDLGPLTFPPTYK